MTARPEVCWRLLYTRPRCETWAEANLRKQGFKVVLPRITRRGETVPFFPRYIFVGIGPDQPQDPLHGTFGVQYVVMFGNSPARVPQDVISEICDRMNEHGIILVDSSAPSPLFSKRERERIRTIVRLTQAGFRVKAG